MPPSLISFGPVTLHLYGLFFAAAVLTGFGVAWKRALKYRIKREEVENLFLLAVFSGIVFARIYHVLDYLSYYRDHPWAVFAVWEGGLGIFGGILGGIFGVGFYCRRRRLDFLTALDLLAPSLALGQAIGRWGNFFNQEAFGPPTDLPWKIFISRENRPSFWTDFSFFHPVFLYESILDLGNFLVLVWLAARAGKEKKGMIFSLYLINYGLIRFLVEFFRWDTARLGEIKAANLFSGGFVLLGLYFLKRSAIINKSS